MTTTTTIPALPSPAPHVWELRPLSPAGVRCVLCGERAARSHQRTPCEPDGWPDTLTDLGGPSCPDDDGDADDDDLIRELAAGWEPGGSGGGVSTPVDRGGDALRPRYPSEGRPR